MIDSTKIVYADVDSNIDLVDINKMLNITILPFHFKNYKEIFIVIVCREPNDYKWEAYSSQDVLYCILPLDYQTVKRLGYAEVTVLIKDELRRFAYQTEKIYEKVEAA